MRHSADTPHITSSIKQLILILMIALAALWLAPDIAASFDHKPDAAWAHIQKEQVIRFAIDASYMPFDGLGSHNDFYGIDVEIASEIARRIGVPAQFINANFDSLYDVLKVGQADATISALMVDPARRGQWQYSTAYFDAGLVLIRPAQISETSPISSVAVEYGSQADAQARYLARRQEGITIVYVDSNAAALQSITNGDVDSAIIDGVSAEQLLPKYPGVRRMQNLTHEPYAIAVWGDSTQLLAAINAALSSMRQDGTIDRIVNSWMEK